MNFCSSENFQAREYKDMMLYRTKKAWMNGPIWAEEMRSLDKRLGKEKRKILLLVDNCPSHIKVELQNVKLEFFMAGATATLQV